MPNDELIFELLMEIVPYVFTALLVEVLLFGIQFILFCICLYILATRRNTAHVVIMISIIIMFAISVADIVMSFRWAVQDVPATLKLKMSPETAVARVLPKAYLYVTNNLIADGLLTYRCYKVWNGKKIILVVAGVALVADSVWGFISMKGSGVFAATFVPMFFWSVFAFNIIMTFATAGRIWWVARTVHPLLDNKQMKRYHTAIAIIVESGAIYPIAVLLVTALPPDKKYRLVFLLIAFRVVCIMPTLMLVQVHMSRHSMSNEQKRRDMFPQLYFLTNHQAVEVPQPWRQHSALKTAGESEGEMSSKGEMRYEYARKTGIL